MFSMAGNRNPKSLQNGQISKDKSDNGRRVGSGLGYCDFGPSLKKLAFSIAECRVMAE
jgi:hypothetical protein